MTFVGRLREFRRTISSNAPSSNPLSVVVLAFTVGFYPRAVTIRRRTSAHPHVFRSIADVGCGDNAEGGVLEGPQHCGPECPKPSRLSRSATSRWIAKLATAARPPLRNSSSQTRTPLGS
jgi:hypothetical protein